jgi:hypothetical protein
MYHTVISSVFLRINVEAPTVPPISKYKIVKYEFLPYVDIVICIVPYPILETWSSIYRGQEGTV